MVFHQSSPVSLLGAEKQICAAVQSLCSFPMDIPAKVEITIANMNFA